MSFERFSQPKIANGAAIFLLLLMGVLMGGAVRRQSITLDEVAHIGAGVSYLQKLDMRLNTEHPPLGKVLAAIPLVLRGAKADYSGVTWSFSNGFFNQYLGESVFGHWFATRWNDPYSTVFWGRMPMLLITLLLGWTVYGYGSKLGGTWGGLLCLCFYISMPTFLTFGPLVLTDIIFTMFALLALWTFADLWRSPERKALVKFGLALGGADAGQWAVVSAGMIMDGHNCPWLLQYPRETIAAGSMYAFQLPTVIPAIGSPNGPPAAEARHNLGGAPNEMNFSAILAACIRDPQQLQPTTDHFQKMFQEQQEKTRRKK